MNTAPEGDEGNGFLAVLDKARNDFKAAMDDDFNTPRAIAVLQDLTREVNTLLNSDATVGLSVLNTIYETYAELGGGVLGLIPASDTASSNGQREAGLIELLIDMRARARASKNYAESDRIRDELAKLGVVLEDRATGTVWRVS
jgi:cysteinyl-tRNA synthetase